MHRFRGRRPQPAMVVALLALFVALGGNALARLLITSNGQVARGTIAGHHPGAGMHPNIVVGSISASDLSPALKASLTPRCPRGLQRAADICFDGKVSLDSLQGALQACAFRQLRLPSAAELALVYDHLGAPQDQEWIDTAWVSENGSGNPLPDGDSGTQLAENSSRQLQFVYNADHFPFAYRCVTSAMS